MSLLDRIDDCRRWDPDAYRPFFIGDLRVGRVRHAFACRLADFGSVFEVGAGWIAKLRWQRTDGGFIDTKQGVTPEKVAEAMPKISDFDNNPQYPASPNDSMGVVLAKL